MDKHTSKQSRKHKDRIQLCTVDRLTWWSLMVINRTSTWEVLHVFYFMETSCLDTFRGSIRTVSWKIPHLVEMPCVENSISMNEFSKLHAKYGMVPHV